MIKNKHNIESRMIWCDRRFVSWDFVFRFLFAVIRDNVLMVWSQAKRLWGSCVYLVGLTVFGFGGQVDDVVELGTVVQSEDFLGRCWSNKRWRMIGMSTEGRGEPWNAWVSKRQGERKRWQLV
jgi:hypothetical protein